jgi:hypothetical protein
MTFDEFGSTEGSCGAARVLAPAMMQGNKISFENGLIV